eukprot:GEMP01051414.1.p1 GENE.GEMP01051414.1~~GEMP01051414.1.p1  ORF type:complete len:247 (+),score=60.58 GEMP01051414.1:70-810(+)
MAATKRTSVSSKHKVKKQHSKDRKANESRKRAWTAKENALLAKLNTPQKIQAYLDTLAYDPADGCRSVRSTVHTKQAHCLGGALLGAHCLHRAGYGEPRIVCIDSVPGIDDGHAVALYQVDGLLGCVAKSNYTLIRSRDPMYRSLRELMMSYHDFYFNSKGVKSMLGYTPILYLDKIDKKCGGRKDWMFAPAKRSLPEFEAMMDVPLISHMPKRISRRLVAHLMPASKQVLAAALIGSNPVGLYKA